MKVLDRAWINCLKMWRWVSKNLPDNFYDLLYEDREEVIINLKKKWLGKNRFTLSLNSDCFFCEYDRKHRDDCNSCPAILVDDSFHCRQASYDCFQHPKNFYKQVVFLNYERMD